MDATFDDFWKKKLAAWLHDPAEKALVLMRDSVGHEQGSVKALRDRLGIGEADFDPRADRFAAAADRPQWPCDPGRPRPTWARVDFASSPLLIHPLSGDEIDLGNLSEIEAAHIRNVSLDHFDDLIERSPEGKPDYRLTHLAFWRFGPEPKLAAPELGELWRVLPADTRVPDHTIWAHLDTVSALAGAMAGDQPALLTMSFGPVQGFIAQARSTSDLWAGSHLLSSLVWEGMKVICDSLGPDAIAFPCLRGVAAVDAWLLGLAEASGNGERWRQRFKTIGAEWLLHGTDANPLFAATLPNKFTAIVPTGRVQQLAEEVTRAMRRAARDWAIQSAQRVLGDGGAEHWRPQLDAQFKGFPEAHWAAAEWPVGKTADGLPESTGLKEALAKFGTEGLFGEPVWKVLNRELEIDGAAFFKPNAGILYPAVHDLTDRVLAADKSLRPFPALTQRGHRCTLCGEREWLAQQGEDLALSPGQRRDTVWSRQAGKFGIKQGEHLCAVCTLKRAWPSIFAESARKWLDDRPDRFVVSTHTMALAHSLDRLAREAGEEAQVMEKLSALSRQFDVSSQQPAALPGALYTRLRKNHPHVVEMLKRLPSALDDERSEEGTDRLRTAIGELLGSRPETYYALIQMDGDRMGAWLAGNEADYQCRFPETWHPQVRHSLDRYRNDPAIRSYLESARPASPARHAAISAALNDFSTTVAPHIVEQIFKGKLIYAGGDDLLAMLSVDDLLPAMLLLRAAYSGTGRIESFPLDIDACGLQLGKGFVRLGRRLMPMMGARATASMGAVVAHHQAPLSAVLRQLRRAEKTAKEHGRNAFSLRVLKRAGGEAGITCPFWSTMRPKGEAGELPIDKTALGLAIRLLTKFAKVRDPEDKDSSPDTELSRRAVYNTCAWLRGLPGCGEGEGHMQEEEWQAMATARLCAQFRRQGSNEADSLHDAADLVELAILESSRLRQQPHGLIENLLVVAEFFAREGRGLTMKEVEA